MKLDAGDTVGVLVNLELGKMAYFGNGKYLGVAFDQIDRSVEYYPVLGGGTTAPNQLDDLEIVTGLVPPQRHF